MSEADRINLTRAAGVATITIDRPEKKNALTKEMFDRLGDLFREVAFSENDRVLVIQGVPGSFCSGADLTSTGGQSMSGFGPLDGASWMREIHETALALHKVSQPTVAAVNGVAAGAGANLALGCDLVFASESARFSQIFVNRGLSLDFGGTWLLPRLVGTQRAKDLAFRGSIIGAQEARDLGLVLEVVPDGDLTNRVGSYAAELAGQPPVPLSLMKTGLNRSLSWTMEETLEYESVSQATCFTTEDVREALMAWVQKREAVYKGR